MFSAEQNYNIKNKELLAIMVALEKYYIYIKNAVKTTIYIDYKNLLLFTTIKELNRQ